MHITKSKKILDLIEMESRILVIIVGMYCYWYSVTIWNGDSDVERCMTKPLLNRIHRNVVGKQKAGTAMTQVMETEHLHIVLFDDFVEVVRYCVGTDEFAKRVNTQSHRTPCCIPYRQVSCNAYPSSSFQGAFSRCEG